MRIATWNINSVRLRQDLVADFMNNHEIDILCLQETKTPDVEFPYKIFRKNGYEHFHIKGQKGYNGVAIISKLPLHDVATHDRLGQSDSRHIHASVEVKGLKDLVQIHNVYLPAGGYEPDPIINPKFQHKLDFVDELTTWFPENFDNTKPMIVLGDLNIAPYENDVWNHKQMLNVVSHTPDEVDRFNRMRENFGWVDAIRHFVPETEKLYSWWSYRSADWTVNDRGRRLDHIWVTKPLVPHLKAQQILRDARSWERPSDHVPVILDFQF